MPTLRVISLDTEYHRVGGPARRAIAVELRKAAASELMEDSEGVEAFWWPPLDSESAENVLPFSVDVEYSSSITYQTCRNLANRILEIFNDSPAINSGEQFGVWIKTPHKWTWKDRTKQ